MSRPEKLAWTQDGATQPIGFSLASQSFGSPSRSQLTSCREGLTSSRYRPPLQLAEARRGAQRVSRLSKSILRRRQSGSPPFETREGWGSLSDDGAKGGPAGRTTFLMKTPVHVVTCYLFLTLLIGLDR